MEDALMTYGFIKRFHHMLTLDWQMYSIYVLEHSALAKRADEFGLSTTPLPDDVLVEVMMHKVQQGLTLEESTAATIRFGEKLKRFLHPLNRIMDIESAKLILLAQKSKGVAPHKIKETQVKI